MPEDPQSPIKGLQSFRQEDYALFKRLQREDIAGECFQFITSKNYRLGILCGESGVGKTSLIQASLIPRLSGENSTFQCVYIKLSNEYVISSIRNAFIKQLDLPEEETRDKDFINLLNKAREKVGGKTLVLIFDQFEQFFVHRKTREKRKPFLDIIEDWYKNYGRYPMKIFICIRNDLMGYLFEFQETIEYPLIATQNYFYIEKFTPNQAFQIIKVIAEKENLTFDDEFVRELTETELADRQDGLVSPADIQIFALMVREHKIRGAKAFTREAYEKLGGIESLLFRFLREQLYRPGRKKNVAIYILILLTDLERNVRSGVRTLKYIQNRLKSIAGEKTIQSSLNWLKRLGIVAEVPQMGEDKFAYELTHEKLILPLQKLAGPLIYSSERTNQILDNYYRRWLGNEHAKKFLLGFRDYLKVRKYRPFLNWGTEKEQKEDFIILSEKNLLKTFLLICFSILLLFSPAMLWFSNTGQIWQIQKDIISLLKKTEKNSSWLKRIAASFLIKGEIEKLNKVLENIEEPSLKVKTYLELFRITSILSKRELSDLFFREARKIQDEIEDIPIKARLQIEIADRIWEKPERRTEAVFLLKDVRDSLVPKIESNKIKVDILLEIVDYLFKKKQKEDIISFIDAAEPYTDGIDDNVHKSIALSKLFKYSVLSGKPKELKSFLKDINTIHKKIKSYTYKTEAEMIQALSLSEIGKITGEEEFFKEAADIAEDIKLKPDRYATLRDISSQALDKARETNEIKFVELAAKVAKEIGSDSDRAYCLLQISKYVSSKDNEGDIDFYLKKAEDAMDDISLAESRANMYSELAALYIQKKKYDKAMKLLKAALKTSKRIRYPYEKASVLREIARLSLQIGDKKQALQLINISMEQVKDVREDFYKVSSMVELGKLYAESGELEKCIEILRNATELAALIYYESYRSESLRNIATTAAELGMNFHNESLLKYSIFIINTIKTSADKARVLRDISIIYSKLGKNKEANKLLAESLKSVKDIPEEHFRFAALRSIAELYVQNKNWFKARNIINQITDPATRIQVFGYLLQKEAETKEPDLKKLELDKSYEEYTFLW